MKTGVGSADPYLEIHPGTGPYLLLVHGFLTCRAQWMLNIEALSKVARPVVVELWGHGRSPAPESPEAYRPEGYVKIFETIRRRLGVSKWLICGQSLGASLTLRYALDCPGQVMAQVFTNTTSGLRDVPDVKEAEIRTAFFAEKILEQGPTGIERIPVHPRNARWLPPGVKRAILEDCAPLSVLGVANTVRYTNPVCSVRREIHKNKVPALLVCGRLEKRFKSMRDFAERDMPLLTIADLEAGHSVNIDAAEEFNRITTEFFTKHSGPPGWGPEES
jgi:2-succinyl-6-hydroxy-2,4-cyclohexadiene-1-carboxylate synthase